MNMKQPFHIAVAGTGYVGLVTGVCMAHKGNYVTCVDTDEAKIQKMQQGISPIYEAQLDDLMQQSIADNRLSFTSDYAAAYAQADIIFIGVGTPENPDGSANLRYIATVARQIAESVEKDCLVVVKSTVPVGTGDKIEQFIEDFRVRDVRIEVASNPEFLAQGSAVHDTLHAPRVIIGTQTKEAESILRELYASYELPIVSMSRRSAEMTKYASNDFLALKISYVNDIANLCEMVGANIEEVTLGMSYDPRIGARYLAAGIGYGGSCFPKDTKALKYLAQQHGYELKTIAAAVDVNTAQKVRLFHKAAQRMISFGGLKVAVLGATFKPNTDDLRESPALDNIALLLEEGAEIYVYDPVGLDHLRDVFADRIHYTATPEEALQSANVCFVFTEWKEICDIAPSTYVDLMQKALVYDGRNIYPPDVMAQAGVEYYSIGR